MAMDGAKLTLSLSIGWQIKRLLESVKSKKMALEAFLSHPLFLFVQDLEGLSLLALSPASPGYNC